MCYISIGYEEDHRSKVEEMSKRVKTNFISRPRSSMVKGSVINRWWDPNKSSLSMSSFDGACSSDYMMLGMYIELISFKVIFNIYGLSREIEVHEVFGEMH